jgi:hypothetical protein
VAPIRFGIPTSLAAIPWRLTRRLRPFIPQILAALFISAARALPILAWFHLTLTGLSMFAFLGLLALQPGPALFGAVAWMLNGDGIVWLENPHRLSTLAWTPAVFLFYELAVQRRRIWPGVIAGI